MIKKITAFLTTLFKWNRAYDATDYYRIERIDHIHHQELYNDMRKNIHWR